MPFVKSSNPHSEKQLYSGLSSWVPKKLFILAWICTKYTQYVWYVVILSQSFKQWYFVHIPTVGRMWDKKQSQKTEIFKCIFSTTRHTYYKKHPTRISSIEILVTVRIKPTDCFLFNKGITSTPELFVNLNTILCRSFYYYCYKCRSRQRLNYSVR